MMNKFSVWIRASEVDTNRVGNVDGTLRAMCNRKLPDSSRQGEGERRRRVKIAGHVFMMWFGTFCISGRSCYS